MNTKITLRPEPNVKHLYKSPGRKFGSRLIEYRVQPKPPETSMHLRRQTSLATLAFSCGGRAPRAKPHDLSSNVALRAPPLRPLHTPRQSRSGRRLSSFSRPAERRAATARGRRWRAAALAAASRGGASRRAPMAHADEPLLACASRDPVQATFDEAHINCGSRE